MFLWDTLLGSITGLVGNGITSYINFKNQKIKNEHDEKMVALESAAAQEEAKMQIAIKKTEVEGAIDLAVETADASAYVESVKSNNNQLFSDKWIDKLFGVQGKVGQFFAVPVAILIGLAFAFIEWLRDFMRPGITLYLTGMSTYITIMAWKIMQAKGITNLSTDQAVDIYNQTTSVIIYLTVSCVTWWFADRKTNKFLQDKLGKK